MAFSKSSVRYKIISLLINPRDNLAGLYSPGVRGEEEISSRTVLVSTNPLEDKAGWRRTADEVHDR